MVKQEEKTDRPKIVVTPEEVLNRGKGKEPQAPVQKKEDGELSWKDLDEMDMREEILSEIKARRKKGEGLGQIFKDVIQPLQEYRIYNNLMENLPEFMGMGVGEMGNGKGKKSNGEEEIPPWAAKLIEDSNARKEREKQEDEAKRMAELVKNILAEYGLEPAKGKKGKPRDDDEEMPAYMRKLQEDNKTMAEYIRKKEQEEEQFRKDNQLREGIMQDVDNALKERIRPLESRLQNAGTAAPKGEITALKETIGTLKEVDSLLHPQGAAPGTAKEGLTIDDVGKIRETGMGFIKDGIELFNQTKQDRDQLPSLYDQTPEYKGGNPNIGAPEQQIPPIPNDLQDWINHAQAQNPNDTFVDEYGHRIRAETPTGYATVQDVVNASRYQPEQARASLQSSIDAKTREDAERHQAMAAPPNEPAQPPEPEEKPADEKPKKKREPEPEPESQGEGETETGEPEPEQNSRSEEYPPYRG